mmetsp:Transcript_42841/g.83968  ORF Transcript_42841/g.83968 Transcript_42841/m.83968 type:complete len:446 (+) Transcript_42841:30-1367(+)|eukprot:CAMPEP_0175140988 /NCGR_PEP_ID=MMETSP0087-20121206/11828_1 /TAXON_ID=136419 /ORGANISM="Unknown Unknown, Strain D1" /LENGTH=445 /DNA_ID=CAMNT_0016424299 /DNA_START=30 /DNA_END=1367 /DNA_ORIENTATION=+
MVKVAIIGAGPCGLAALHAFEKARTSGETVPEVVCFEKQTAPGGLWNYDWRVGTDQHGNPIHNSQYRYLWSNGPKECLEMADYTFKEHFGKPIPSFPPRAVLESYIKGRYKKENLDRYVRCSTIVNKVQFDESNSKFTVESRDLLKDVDHTDVFDFVICATGHFSIPNVPEYPGFNSFPGRILHSHDFRDALEFKGQTVAVIGGSYSAEDIALQCFKYGAKKVVITNRTAMGFNWPEGIVEVPCLTHTTGSTMHFKDGTTVEVDAIVCCTGYKHHFPFLPDSLRLKTGNILYPDNLYKGVVWTKNPRFMYLGMQDQFYTFSMFDVQAFFARDICMGKLSAPSLADMEADIKKWMEGEAKCGNPHDQIAFQTAYVVELNDMVKYAEKIDVAKEFEVWEHHKDEDILTYRDRSFTSIYTGDQAPVHHTPWLKAMDDTIECFMNQPSK